MQAVISRRTLFARLRGGPVQLRPPWSIDDDFTERCTQCGQCISACPTKLITKGHAGYPIVDFSEAGCTFCGACREACGEGCFVAGARQPWMLKAGISTACVETKGVSCRICQDTCETSAIRFRPMVGGRATPEINTEACTGCGTCVRPCPVSAISISIPEPATPEVRS